MGGRSDESSSLLQVDAAPLKLAPSLAHALSLLLFFFFFFLQFAKSVVIWCQRLIQAEGGKGE